MAPPLLGFENRPIQEERDLRFTAKVPVSCSKSHGTIWGNTVKCMEDIPSADAQYVLERIVSVPGITKITLGQFGHKGTRNRSQASVGASKTPYVIEGRLYDKGTKGTMQSFQVWAQSDEAKASVVAKIEELLRRTGNWTV